MKLSLNFSPEVRAALDNNLPLVALESTIISHGMPFPQNVETARRVEQTVRDKGAVPATIAVLNGRIHIGLTDEELQVLGESKGVLKLSRRDLPYALAAKANGATTVSATMICAHLAGIRIFATGGIGGVHRDGENTMDVSADLTELARTPVAVVCAGVKSILDIGRTLEYLETQGVPVYSYGTDAFPAFYTRESGYKSDYAFYSPKDLANALNMQWAALNYKGGALIANPVPEAYSLDLKDMELVIQKALAEAAEQQITGKAITPFLLDKIKSLTAGKSLETNIALILNNAALAAEISVCGGGF